jgi:hypothetical protein
LNGSSGYANDLLPVQTGCPEWGEFSPFGAMVNFMQFFLITNVA